MAEEEGVREEWQGAKWSRVSAGSPRSLRMLETIIRNWYLLLVYKSLQGFECRSESLLL